MAQLCFFEVGTWPHATEEASSYRSKKKKMLGLGFSPGAQELAGNGVIWIWIQVREGVNCGF